MAVSEERRTATKSGVPLACKNRRTVGEPQLTEVTDAKRPEVTGMIANAWANNGGFGGRPYRKKGPGEGSTPSPGICAVTRRTSCSAAPVGIGPFVVLPLREVAAGPFAASLANRGTSVPWLGFARGWVDAAVPLA